MYLELSMHVICVIWISPPLQTPLNLINFLCFNNGKKEFNEKQPYRCPNFYFKNLYKEPKGGDYNKCILGCLELDLYIFMMGQSEMIITKEKKIEL